jgi:GTP-binding protein
MPFTVAVIGRPNVGKSTLFNRLTGKRQAIVDDTPGVTRDRREGQGAIADIEFRLIDTAGLDRGADGSLEARMQAQTELALADADVALFLIDARAGVTPLDEYFAGRLRRQKTPVIVVANKCEGGKGEPGRLEAYKFGFGDPIAVSAEHGEGLGDLYDALRPFAEAHAADAIDTAKDDADADANVNPLAAPDRPLQLAVIGRPNVGKSTLVNRLIGEDRMLTGPEAGITRDAISVMWRWRDRDIRLIDTAGLRRKARVVEKLETLSVGDTLNAIRFAEVVVLVVDATMGLEKQDLSIARLVMEEGRGMVIAANKWDLVTDRRKAREEVAERLEWSLSQVAGVPVVECSGLTGRGMEKLLPAAARVYDVWNQRVSTGDLNRWLQSMTDAHPPPMAKGRQVKLRYMTQAKSRPPTFIVFSSQPKELVESYQRYLINGLRDAFGFAGVPIRIHMRKGGDNPYAKG